jgi:hypothetical protein
MSNRKFPQPNDRIKGLIDHVLKQARRQIVERGQAVPAAILMHDSGMEVIPLDLDTAADKDRYAFMIRELANLHEAHTVVMISEAWTLPAGTSPEQAQVLYEKYKRVEAMPGRVEIVHIVVETRDGGRWDGSARIVRNGRSVKLDAPQYRDLSGASYDSYGRFTGFFAPERQVPDDLRDAVSSARR